MRYIVLSFDDGTIYDKRFIDILNKYNVTCSFNLNSGLDDFVWYYEENKPIRRLKLKDNVSLYDRHEICSHSFSHPHMTQLNKEGIINEVKKDIETLKQTYKRNIDTFAFPFEDYNDEVIDIIRENTNIKNIRISKLDDSYMPKDRYHIHLNAFYDEENIYEKIEKFSKNNLKNSLFVIVGHSYEFEVKNDWDKIEKLIKYLSELKDVKIVSIKDAIDNIFA